MRKEGRLGLWMTGNIAKPQGKERKMAKVEVRAERKQMPVTWALNQRELPPSILREFLWPSHQEHAPCPIPGDLENTALEIQKKSPK